MLTPLKYLLVRRLVLFYMAVLSLGLSFSCLSTRDIILESAVYGTLVVDAVQTVGLPPGRESNVFLGRSPSVVGVVVYFVLAASIHGVIAKALPTDWRTGWQVGWIITESWQVGWNARAKQ